MTDTNDKLLGATIVKDYDPPTTVGTGWPIGHINPNRPLFQPRFIPMMMSDPRLRLGIKFIKGPIIQNVQFKIQADSAELEEYVTEELDNFRLNGLSSALDSLWWGYSAHEIIYRRDASGLWRFKKLKKIGQQDVKPVHIKGRQIGMNVYRVPDKPRVFVPFPKALWCVHQSMENQWFGCPAIYGAFEPWWETWCTRGYRDTRSLWFFKNAFSGPIIKYPPGSTPVDRTQDGEPIMRPNKQIADEIADKMMTGSGATFPTSAQDSGLWDFEPGLSQPIPDGLLQYGDDLASEKLEGLGVPPEVISSDGTGAYAGRAIPMQGFMATLQDIACEHFSAYDEQSLERRVRSAPQFQGQEYQILVEGLYEASPYGEDGGDGEQQVDENGNPIESDPNSPPGQNGSGKKSNVKNRSQMKGRPKSPVSGQGGKPAAGGNRGST